MDEFLNKKVTRVKKLDHNNGGIAQICIGSVPGTFAFSDDYASIGFTADAAVLHERPFFRNFFPKQS